MAKSMIGAVVDLDPSDPLWVCVRYDFTGASHWIRLGRGRYYAKRGLLFALRDVLPLGTRVRVDVTGPGPLRKGRKAGAGSIWRLDAEGLTADPVPLASILLGLNAIGEANLQGEAADAHRLGDVRGRIGSRLTPGGSVLFTPYAGAHPGPVTLYWHNANDAGKRLRPGGLELLEARGLTDGADVLVRGLTNSGAINREGLDRWTGQLHAYGDEAGLSAGDFAFGAGCFR